MPDDASPVLLHALERLLIDRDRGALRGLTTYQDLAPGFEREIAEQYESLVAGHDAGDEDPGVRRIGRYRILEELGRGGQGVVYRAVDDELDRPVAVKLLTGVNALDEDALTRFLREARAASRGNHPGICPVYEWGLDDGVPFLAMALIEGRSFAQVIAERAAQREPLTRADIDATLTLFEQIARALHAAHELGIVHRDVKPANILLVPDGHPMVLDFGIARMIEGDERLTQSGHVLGTPAYMSPEQVAGDDSPIDQRTDVYSLGVSLFEALTLTRPFTAPTRDGLYRLIVSQPPPDPRRLCPAIPVDVSVILETTLQKDPDDRYSNAASLADDLGRARRGEPLMIRPPGRIRRLGKWAARNPARVAGLMLTAALLTVATIIAVQLQRRAQTAEIDREQLADVRRLDALFEETKTSLWPALPEQIPDYEAWQLRVRALIDRREQHRASLVALRARALPFSEADRAADREHYALEYTALANNERQRPSLLDQPAALAKADEFKREVLERVGRRRTWRFADPAEQLFHGQLADLVARLHNIQVGIDEYEVTIADIAARLELARHLADRLASEDADAWQRCTADVAAPTSVYGGVALAPTAGLVPLGRDRDSGLWEFWHVASGARPQWDGEPAGVGKARLHADSGAEGMVLVMLPGGRFQMGAQTSGSQANDSQMNVDPDARDDEAPVHLVELDPFLISKYEVTQGQWVRLHHANPSENTAALLSEETMTPRHPVMRVDWEAAREACRRWALELPTEAQWEYACRAGTNTPFHCGDAAALAEYANTMAPKLLAELGRAPESGVNDPYEVVAPVGALRPNAWGAHDMHGNMAEWCRDAFLIYGEWEHRAGDGMQAHLIGWSHRVRRSGSFLSLRVAARSAAREKAFPSLAAFDSGLRPSRRAPLLR